MPKTALWTCILWCCLAAVCFTARAESVFDVKPRACAFPLALPTRAQMEVELEDYLRLSEEALAMRAMAIRLYRELHAKRRHGPLSGQDLLRLKAGAADLLRQRHALFEVALAHECWLSAPLPADVDAADIQRTGILMTLSAALTLYDNYLAAISLYRDDDALRRQVNRPDLGFALAANELQKADVMFASPEIRQRVRRGIRWFRQHGEKTPSGFEGHAYLVQSIQQSPSLALVQKRRPLYVLGRTFEIFGDYTGDALVRLTDRGIGLSSQVFGNAAGLVETRKGKLYRQPRLTREIEAALQPGDILLEKTPFRLTDTFIPGHWGHAAIWVGTEAELTQLGIWEHPAVIPHQAQIRAGQSVVEALRSGVEAHTLAHFLNIDDLAVLRRSGLADADRAEIVVRTLMQLGKDYDFNFDAETTDRVFCSKLVYLVHGEIAWPTSRVLGRYTVSPDDIARKTLNGGPLAIVRLYHDGRLVADNPVGAMRGFLDADAAPKSSLARH